MHLKQQNNQSSLSNWNENFKYEYYIPNASGDYQAWDQAKLARHLRLSEDLFDAFNSKTDRVNRSSI